ncbi:MAG: hypothetical protein HY720_10735 [Planctomycetes bacterium]|nr:hypothetical protein [Planctomycetota bacterium]
MSENVARKVKDQAREVIEHLPEDAGWDDILYEIYVRQKVSEGLEDARQGRVVSHEELVALRGVDEDRDPGDRPGPDGVVGGEPADLRPRIAQGPS